MSIASSVNASASSRGVLAGLLVASLLCGCSNIAPLRTLMKLRDALKSRDETAVAALVDFPRVKANADARVDERLKQANSDRPLGGLRAAIADRFAERVVDKLATPRGMIGMVCDGSLKAPPSPPPPCDLKGELKDRHSESATRYIATIDTPDGKQVALTVEQESDSVWRVVDMALSPESFEKLRQSITD